jgi:hypothetical protein
MRPALFALAGAIVAAALILAILTRYSDRATPQGVLYVTDRWSGKVRACYPAACRDIETSAPASQK